MNIPVSFRLPKNRRYAVIRWLNDTNLWGEVTYDWDTSILSFGDEQDAVAFSLATNMDRVETTVERMLKDA